MVFYGFQQLNCLLLLICDTLVNYLVYRKMEAGREYKKRWLGVGIFLNLGVLFYFKYYNFFIDNLNMVLHVDLSIRDLVLPMGISFIVFQQIAFLVDAYWEQVHNISLLDYSVLVSYFPHVSSGPIFPAKDFLGQLRSLGGRIDWKLFASGLYMFSMGLGKKVLIADTFAGAVDWGYNNIMLLNSSSALFVSIAYSLQIYFDFSGYSDMAMGISQILQLRIPVNFNSPYKADTIEDFWDRWHITLTRFLTKYIYIPLGGNRKGKGRTCLNILLVFLVSGFWHGASWAFVAWGMVHGLFMIIFRCFRKTFERIPRIINKVILLAFINFTWILFRAGSFQTFRNMMKALLKNEWSVLNQNLCSEMIPAWVDNMTEGFLPYWFWSVLMLLIVLIVTFTCKNVQERAETMKYSCAAGIWIVFVAVLSLLSLSGVSTFVYALF